MRARTLSVVITVIGLVATATSCGKPSESASADSTFVHAMIDLRLVTVNTTLDSAAKARARDSILRHYNTSPAALESTARLLGNNPDRAVELLRMIDLGVRTGSHPAPVPTTPVPAAAVPAPPKPAAAAPHK